MEVQKLFLLAYRHCLYCCRRFAGLVLEPSTTVPVQSEKDNHESLGFQIQTLEPSTSPAQNQQQTMTRQVPLAFVQEWL